MHIIVGEGAVKKMFRNDYNIGFHSPKKDKCNSCETFKNTPEIMKTEEMKKIQQTHEDEKVTTLDEHLEDQNKPNTDPEVLCTSFEHSI